MAFEDGLQVSIEILRNEPTASDSGNQPRPNWTSIETVLGRIDSVGGTERSTMAEATKMTHRAMLPVGTDVTAADRLRANSKVYGIVSVNPIAGAGGEIHHLTLDLKSVG